MHIAGTLTFTDRVGRRLELDPTEIDSFVNLLVEQAPSAVTAIASGALDQATARRAGVALYEATLDVVERNGETSIVPHGLSGSDPVVAFLARLADHVGADDLADAARSTLLDQSHSTPTAGRGQHYATVQRWANYLLTASGPIGVER